MRTRTTLAAILLLAVLAGCQSRQQALKVANDTFSATLEDLTAYRAAGLINDDEQRKIAGYRTQVNGLLEAAGTLLRLNDNAGFDATLDEAHKILREMILARAKAKGTP